MNKNLLIGLMFTAISILFGSIALTYNVGTLSEPGPGLFPFIVSALLAVVGVASIIDSRLEAHESADFKLKNISVITLSLVAFAVVSDYINMSVGIVVLVAIASIGATTYSITRVIKISIGLIAVAFAFKYLLGLNLPLF